MTALFSPFDNQQKKGRVSWQNKRSRPSHGDVLVDFSTIGDAINCTAVRQYMGQDTERGSPLLVLPVATRWNKVEGLGDRGGGRTVNES